MLSTSHQSRKAFRSTTVNVNPLYQASLRHVSHGHEGTITQEKVVVDHMSDLLLQFSRSLHSVE